MSPTPSPVPSTATSPGPEDVDATRLVGGLPEHKHCEVCGRSIAVGNRVCGPACQRKFDEAVRARKRSVYIFVGLMAVLLFLSLYGGKLFHA